MARISAGQDGGVAARIRLRVSHAPHLGCAKFVERFGTDAMRFVNSRAGRRLRLRGMNTRVVQAGLVRPGDVAAKIHTGLAAS